MQEWDEGIKLDGVREYGDGDAVELARTQGKGYMTRTDAGRLVVRGWSECHNAAVEIDLLDLIAWLRANRPDLLEGGAC